MNGYFIDVTNNLLDPKHRQAMGPAVWEFMWCLDKITRIDDDGTGWVLGGKPINISDIQKVLGSDGSTARRNLKRLERSGYIVTQRTPYGIRVWVAKAKKRFGRRDRAFLHARVRDLARSNIRQLQDSKQLMRTPTASALYKGKGSPRSMEYVPVDEDGNESVRRQKGPKPEGKNKIALRLQRKFVELAQKYLGSSPVMDIKGYKMCLYAMNTGGLTEPQIIDLFDEWFKLGRPDEETISITRALSARQIEGYKVRNNVK